MRFGRTFHLVAAALAMAFGSGPAWAQLDAENLLTNVPEGFAVGFQTSQGSMDMMELVPVGETVDDWSAMVTVQVFRSAGGADPDAFAGNLGQMWQGACKGSTASRLDAGRTNGFVFVLWHYACPLNQATGKPESMWLKVIGGADALYAVQYAYRAAPAGALERPALAYLEKATVCDTRRDDRPCPPGM